MARTDKINVCIENKSRLGFASGMVVKVSKGLGH